MTANGVRHYWRLFLQLFINGKFSNLRLTKFSSSRMIRTWKL